MQGRRIGAGECGGRYENWREAVNRCFCFPSLLCRTSPLEGQRAAGSVSEEITVISSHDSIPFVSLRPTARSDRNQL